MSKKSTTLWTVFRYCPDGDKIKILESVPAATPIQAVKEAIKKMFKASGNATHNFADLYAQSKTRRERRQLPHKYTQCQVELTKRPAKDLVAFPSLSSHYYKPIARKVANTIAGSQSAPAGAPAHRVRVKNGCRGRHLRQKSIDGKGAHERRKTSKGRKHRTSSKGRKNQSK